MSLDVSSFTPSDRHHFYSPGGKTTRHHRSTTARGSALFPYRYRVTLPICSSTVTTSSMSGFLSSEAERALMGEEEEARRLFYSDPLNNPPPPGHPAYQGQNSASFVPSQRWTPSYSPGPSGPPMRDRSSSVARPSPFPAESWSNNSWSSLHPDDIDDSSSQVSRSSSPGNPSDLQNFGYPLGDGTSWRCGYPGCTSQAVFTRGCDLRKHFRRHTKTLFCRYKGCPAATEGGFSSRKDRDRHEAKHQPDIPCEWRGCDRVFSRVDNMRDHVRRIHQRKP